MGSMSEKCNKKEKKREEMKIHKEMIQNFSEKSLFL